MSLQDAIDKLQELVPKDAGHLIRHDDWNDLIGALSEYGTTLTSHGQALNNIQGEVDNLQIQLTDVSGQITILDNRVDDLETQISPLLDNYQVNLSCERLSYAMGELCEITATVTDLGGDPLPAPFPWIDFIAAWGSLRAQGGFNTREGAGGNSLSVQVNSQGIAKVMLRSEHSESFSETEESQVDAVVNMQVPLINMTLVEAILGASTPSEHTAQAAYKMVHAEYERKDSKTLRNYADTYHLRNPGWVVDTTTPSILNQWRDYQATVFAMARPDGDPTTPDGARGSASIQVKFRDWLWSWMGFYLDTTEETEHSIAEEFIPMFELEESYKRFDDRFQNRYKERGILGRKKYVDATRKVLDKYDPGTDPVRIEVKEQIEQAIKAQQFSEIYGGGRPGDDATVMQAHLGHGKQAQKVQHSVKQVEQQVEETKSVQDAVNVLEGRMQATERVGADISSNLVLINDNVRAINPLDENSIKANVQKISADIAALKGRIG